MMLFGAGIFNALNTDEKLRSINIFYNFTYLTLVLCILQTMFSFFQDLTYTFYTSRTAEEGAIALTGRGVTGFAPEPAYGSAHIVGIGMIAASIVRPKVIQIFTIIFILLLMRSISGYVYGILYLIFIFSIYFRFTPKNIIYALFSVTILFLVAISNLDSNNYYYLIKRITDFAQLSIQYGSLIEAERLIGSSRLIAIYDSYTKIFF